VRHPLLLGDLPAPPRAAPGCLAPPRRRASSAPSRRLFKLPGRLEADCEDYGQAVVYKGTLPGRAAAFDLDSHHHIEARPHRPQRGDVLPSARPRSLPCRRARSSPSAETRTTCSPRRASGSTSSTSARTRTRRASPRTLASSTAAARACPSPPHRPPARAGSAADARDAGRDRLDPLSGPRGRRG